MIIESKKYPIGHFVPPQRIDHEQRDQWIEEIKDFPAEFRRMAQDLTPIQLNTPYRPDGWKALQVIHHLPDSHVNAYLRFRWALSEEQPQIKPFDEKSWAEARDYKKIVPEVSLHFLEAIHSRWYELMRHMEEEDWSRTYFHPEDDHIVRLDQALGSYVWHGKHHLAHLAIVKELV